jgi:hypothetical protein
MSLASSAMEKFRRLHGERKPKYASREEWLNAQWDVSQPSRGLGDTVAKITHATGLDKIANFLAHGDTTKSCGGCAQRQAVLNRAFPYDGS